MFFYIFTITEFQYIYTHIYMTELKKVKIA